MYMIVYTGLWYFIRVYRRTYAYILFSKQYEKRCTTAGFEPAISCILSAVITITLQASTRRYYRCISTNPFYPMDVAICSIK